jgi:hypothetical protein
MSTCILHITRQNLRYPPTLGNQTAYRTFFLPKVRVGGDVENAYSWKINGQCRFFGVYSLIITERLICNI